MQPRLRSLRWASKPESSCAANTRVAPPGNDPTSELEHKKYYVDFLCRLEKIVSWFLDFLLVSRSSVSKFYFWRPAQIYCDWQRFFAELLGLHLYGLGRFRWRVNQ